MGLIAYLLGREAYDPADDEDQADDEEAGDELDGCPAFGCGCKPCSVLRQLCYHEGGHVVAHFALEIPFTFVSAGVDRVGSEGHGVTSMDGLAVPCETGDDWNDRIVMSMAGAAAEELVFGSAAMASGDAEDVAAYLEEPAAAEVDPADAAEEAAAIVEDWSVELDAIAAALFEAGTLSAEECEDLI